MSASFSADESNGESPSFSRYLPSGQCDNHHRGRSLMLGQCRESLPNDDGITEMAQSRIIWPDETENCWSDAGTADAVLSLLRKEPVQSPSGDTSRSSRGILDQAYLTCTVCLNTLELDSYPESSITAGCDHSSMPGRHICKNCLQRSLDAQFSSSRLSPLTCPLCHQQLSDEEVRRWASKETFEAYDHTRTWQILEEDAEFVMCIRQDCGYGQLHAGGLEDPIVVCGSCGTRTCFIHRHSVWHDGLTCSEYEELIHLRSVSHEARSEFQTSCQMFPEVHGLKHKPADWSIEEDMSTRAISETARACPSCDTATERAGGCKHMTCTYIAIE
ncbi:hypothetical protein BDV23DRAFT_159925 [Aspergillus alliaceus]|uniref:RBR-type E3 ubiquitin transferase n=1 Tax=Petromyces alliaceus TaxID=209559 RepID=A0A5N7C1S4_PETAA|nr:hypothetical protein BDV23DRAFT_159925 [Aspergillus alliaceus]